MLLYIKSLIQKSTHCSLEIEAMATDVSSVYCLQVQLSLKGNDKKKRYECTRDNEAFDIQRKSANSLS